MELADIFRINSEVSPEAVEDFLAASEVRHFAKGEMLAEHEKYCGYLFLVKEGYMGMSILQDGEEETICFGEAGCCFMDFNSYYKKEPAFFGCMAHTPLDAYCIEFSKLDELLERHVSLLRWFSRALVEEFYLLEVRANNYRRLDAYTRFKIFMTARPNIYRTIPAKYIAQYLQVRPETLYRMRARLLKEK